MSLLRVPAAMNRGRRMSCGVPLLILLFLLSYASINAGDTDSIFTFSHPVIVNSQDDADLDSSRCQLKRTGPPLYTFEAFFSFNAFLVSFIHDAGRTAPIPFHLSLGDHESRAPPSSLG